MTWKSNRGKRLGIARLIGCDATKLEWEMLRGNTGTCFEVGARSFPTFHVFCLSFFVCVWEKIQNTGLGRKGIGARNSVQQRCRRIPGAACRCSETDKNGAGLAVVVVLLYTENPYFLSQGCTPRESGSDPYARCVGPSIRNLGGEKHMSSC